MVSWQVYVWAGLALLLIAAETAVPGAFLMWLGFAAAVMFLIVLVMPTMPLLAQAVLFSLLCVAFIAAYQKWFRARDRKSDQPALNRRTAALVGRVVTLERAIVQGRGRVQIADAFWEVTGPNLPAGSSVRIVDADAMTLRVESAE